MRKVVLSFLLAISVLLGMNVYAENFTDTGNSLYYDEIEELAELKIVCGFGDLSFRPKSYLTRAEAAKIFAIATGYSDTKHMNIASKSKFKDVNNEYWAYKYIDYITKGIENEDDTSYSIISGYEDSMFRPNNNITMMEFLKMSVCSLGDSGYYADVAEHGGYPNGYVYVAEKYGFSDGIDISAVNDSITREQATKIISNTINIPLNRHEYLTTITQDHKLDGVWLSILCDGLSNDNYPLETLKTIQQSGSWSYHAVYSSISPLENALVFYAYGTIKDVQNSTITIIPSVVVNIDASLYDGIDMLTVENDDFDLCADSTQYYFEFNKQNGRWVLKNYAKV